MDGADGLVSLLEGASNKRQEAQKRLAEAASQINGLASQITEAQLKRDNLEKKINELSPPGAWMIEEKAIYDNYYKECRDVVDRHNKLKEDSFSLHLGVKFDRANLLSVKFDNNLSDEEFRKCCIYSFIGNCHYRYNACITKTNSLKEPEFHNFEPLKIEVIDFLKGYGLTEDETKEIEHITEMLSSAVNSAKECYSLAISLNKMVDEANKRVDKHNKQLVKYNELVAEAYTCIITEFTYVNEAQIEMDSLQKDLSELSNFITAHPKHAQIEVAFDVVSSIVSKLSKHNGAKPLRIEKITGIKANGQDPQNIEHLLDARSKILETLKKNEYPSNSEQIADIISYSGKDYQVNDFLRGLSCFGLVQGIMLLRKKEISYDIKRLSTYATPAVS